MDNVFRHFSSQGTDYKHYEMVVCKEQQTVEVIVNSRNGDTTEYMIPFEAFVDVGMSTKEFMSPAESAAYALELLNGSSDKVTTDTGSLVKRTLAGGLLGGPVGAAIGGITASRTIEKKVHASRIGYVLSITFNDLDLPYLKYDCGEDEDSARAIFSIIKIICGRNTRDTHSEGIVVKHIKKQSVQDNASTKKEASDGDMTKSNVQVVIYALFQAVFMGLVLIAWNAGWWPVFIVAFAVCVQCIPMLTWACDFYGKPFSSFGKGVIITSLFILMPLTLLPWYATCNIHFCLNDTVFYIHPYEGGFITFSITAVLAMLISVAIGCYFKDIVRSTDKLWFGKWPPVPFGVSVLYFVVMCGAALLSQFKYIEIYIKVFGCLYAILSGLFVYSLINDYKPCNRQLDIRAQMIVGVIFQILLYATVVILCCHFDILCYRMYDWYW